MVRRFGDLRPGDEMLLHDHRAAPRWGDPGAAERDAAEGYLLGLLIGDGTLKQDKAVFSAWPGGRSPMATASGPVCEGVMQAALEAATRLPHRADFQGWIEVPGRGEYRLSLGALNRLAEALGLRPRAKHDHAGDRAALSRISTAASCAACSMRDGSVQGTQEKA